MNQVQEISNRFEGEYSEKATTKKHTHLGSLTNSLVSFNAVYNECKITLYGNYPKGAKLPSTYEEPPIYTIDIQSDLIDNASHFHPKTNWIFRIEQLISKKHISPYHYTDTFLCKSIFGRNDLIANLNEVQASLSSIKNNSGGKYRLVPIKRNLTVFELETFFATAIKLTEEIKKAYTQQRLSKHAT